ncbi:MAG: hypothetical protein ABJA98_23345 [Acidobacteriota bacterium]
MNDPQRDLLRHALAAVAYRGRKAITDAPEGFAGFRAGDASRSPEEILAHIGDLFEWALSLVRGAQTWHDSPPLDWPREVTRFFDGLKAFDDALASDQALAAPAERLLQGPVADALTHVGQLTLLRRLAGAPIRGENYYAADMAAGRVGPVQAVPTREW